MRNRLPAAMVLAAAALLAAGCGGSSPGSGGTSGTSSGPASSGSAVKTTTISGVTVLTNAKGFTLYWFVPDTSTKSNCNGSCAQIWPPVKGPATAGAGVTGKLGTITRPDGSAQATYEGIRCTATPRAARHPPAGLRAAAAHRRPGGGSGHQGRRRSRHG